MLKLFMASTLLTVSVVGISTATDLPDQGQSILDNSSESISPVNTDQVLADLKTAQTLDQAIDIVGNYYASPVNHMTQFVDHDAHLYVNEFKRLVDADQRDDTDVISSLWSMTGARYMGFKSDFTTYSGDFILPVIRDRFKSGLDKAQDFSSAVNLIRGLLDLHSSYNMEKFFNMFASDCILKLRRLYQQHPDQSVTRESLIEGLSGDSGLAQLLFDEDLKQGFSEEVFSRKYLSMGVFISDHSKDLFKKMDQYTKDKFLQFVDSILDPNKVFYSEASIAAINATTDDFLERGDIMQYLKALDSQLKILIMSLPPQKVYDHVKGALEAINQKVTVSKDVHITLENAKLTQKICQSLFDSKFITDSQFRELSHFIVVNFFLKIDGAPLQVKVKEALSLIFQLGADGQDLLAQILIYDLIEKPKA
ncbi:MAG: hypothetical protein KF820_02940 [Candidatus Paracaedibacteraceae bacterium]|nr:hypothetical protein [Candidatus Paracaedibacteraceae bacterium]